MVAIRETISSPQTRIDSYSIAKIETQDGFSEPHNYLPEIFIGDLELGDVAIVRAFPVVKDGQRFIKSYQLLNPDTKVIANIQNLDRPTPMVVISDFRLGKKKIADAIEVAKQELEKMKFRTPGLYEDKLGENGQPIKNIRGEFQYIAKQEEDI